MQASWFPEAVCNKIDKINRTFLWTGDVSKKKLHLINWQQVLKSKKDGGLGLRDARTNNEALLSKLVWKILRGEKSLWLDLIYAKYIKEGSVLDGRFKPGDSRLWKGITRCASLLRDKFYWVLGDGRKIRFWLDLWFGSERLIDRVDRRDFDVKISELLSADGCWDFSTLHTEVPLQIRTELEEANFRLYQDEDMVLWKNTSSGIHSCRSAFDSIREQFSSHNPNSETFSWIWRSPINNKLRHFIWLAAHNRLAGNEVRYSRGCSVDAACCICGNPCESALHILRHCPIARDVWREILTEDSFDKFCAIPDTKWLRFNVCEASFDINIRIPSLWCRSFVIALWFIWKRRNNFVFTGMKENISHTLFLIKQMCWDMSSGNKSQASETVERWRKPDAGWIKLNVDGSWCSEAISGGVGGVARDEHGNWIWGFARKGPDISLDNTEVVSLLTGLQIAWDRRTHRIIVETDSANAYGWIKGDSTPPPHLESLVRECKSLLRMPWEVQLRKIGRSANCCADALAKAGRAGHMPIEVMDSAPPAVRHVLA